MSARTAVWPALAATLALFLAVTLALAYTPLGGETDLAGAEPASAVTASGASAVEVRLSEFAIDPAEVTVAPGSATFTLTNTGALPHDLTIAELGETSPEVPGGSSIEWQVDGLEEGAYTLLCSIVGHEAAGMQGTLTVSGEGEAVVAAAVAHDDHAATAGVAAMTMTPEEMVAHHDEGIANFLSGYGGEVYGNNALEPTIDEDGAKVFELTASEIEWETKPGVTKQAMAYNGQVPGPMIRAELGERIKIVLNNEMSAPTAIHTHGLLVPNAMDGVPSVTQKAVMPGESFTYDIELRNAGSHMYHSHFDSATQVPAGLLGAIIVEDPQNPVTEDIDYTMILNDGPLGFTLNGKDFPATEPIVAKRGEKVRVRFMNEGLQIHPMHLHGMHMTVIEKDGYPLPQPYKLDTVNIAPGERIDVVVEAEEPGAWAFHCHILNHAEGPDGMFGMVTALVIEE